MFPTAAPAIRATFDPRELDSRDATRTQASIGLPDPARAATRFALALCEVEAGMRPAAQLERSCHHSLYEKLEERVRRSGGPTVSVHSLVDVITQQQAQGLVDAVVLLHRGERVAAVTMRLDAAPGHWQVTELQYGRFPEPERANNGPVRAASRPLGGHGSRAGEVTRSARAHCGSTLGGREALKHACTLLRGHQGRCSWWEWHQERVARHEHARRWRHHLNAPAFRLEDYQDYLAQRFPRSYRGQDPSARPAPGRRPAERTQQRGGGGRER
jgi:hypothetical protein